MNRTSLALVLMFAACNPTPNGGGASTAASSSASATPSIGTFASASAKPAASSSTLGESTQPAPTADADLAFNKNGVRFARDGAHSGISITLKNEFIERYKNRATIATDFTVVHAHKKPNAPSKDGDMHVAGTAPQIELNSVAEIMNAKAETDAVDAIHKAESSGKPVKLEGAWRLWCEHGGTSRQVQGGTLPEIEDTNPDHVFEVHPVTKLAGKSLLTSLHKIDGYDPKEAKQAFLKYESLSSEIVPKATTTTIKTIMAGYNYVAFRLEVRGDSKELEDGRVLMANARDLDGDLVVRNRRMVFVKDSPPEQATKPLKIGECVDVLGIPRIDLALVSWRAHHKDDTPDALEWNLPYEILVVGVLGKPNDCDG